MTQANANPTGGPSDGIEESLESIRQALEGLRFGNISVTIHEGRVVQIDVTEKRRFSVK